jgi:hypothetical protein|nr:MAG TPA: hypothetical protein [Bacteriophage sp.]
MDELNRQFEECYLLVLSDEEKLYESIVGLTKEFTEGKIPMDLYVKSLNIANATVQEIHSKRSVLHRLIQQIRYHLFRMEEYIEANYEDGMDFIVAPNQDYIKLHNDFLQNSNRFIKEWELYNKEHGHCTSYRGAEVDSFKLVFDMINLLMDEYDAHVYPDEELMHIYVLARELPDLLFKARDLALNMNPRIIADQYYMKKYLNKPSPYTSRNYRTNVCPDFEYAREPKSQMHQQMTSQMSSNFRHSLQATGQMDVVSGNINPNLQPHVHPETLFEELYITMPPDPIFSTPPDPKLQRPNVRSTYPSTVIEGPKVNNEFGRGTRSEQPTVHNTARSNPSVLRSIPPGSNLDNGEELTRKL